MAKVALNTRRIMTGIKSLDVFSDAKVVAMDEGSSDLKKGMDGYFLTVPDGNGGFLRWRLLIDHEPVPVEATAIRNKSTIRQKAARAAP